MTTDTTGDDPVTTTPPAQTDDSERPDGEPQLPPLKTAGTVVDERARSLQNGLLNPVRQDPGAVAALARLRRAVGKPPGAVVEALDYTAIEVPDDSGDEATPQEWAVHVAMTLFAMHQQSRGTKMHRRGRGGALGTAFRSLHPGDAKSIPDPLARRFRMLGTADSFTELTHHLRGVVQLLRAGDTPLDYGLLADQLVTWQRYGPDQVQLAWGRGFHRTRRTAA